MGFGSGSATGRRGGVLLAASVALAAHAAVAEAGPDRAGETRACAPGLSVEIRSASQKLAIERGKVRARVSSCAGGAGGDPGAPPPGAAAPLLELSPDTGARHVNGTPRSFSLGGDAAPGAELALVECGSFAEVPGQITRSGTAVDVSAANRCVRPVAYLDADDDGALDRGADGAPSERYAAGGKAGFEPLGAVQLGASERCDAVDPARCLFPWPNDHFTAADPGTDTGRRVNLDPASMPRNRLGLPVHPADYNRSDGFSPGQMIVTKVPGLETPEAFEATGAPPITHLERSLDPDSPVVVLDADTGERHLFWSELDANPADPADVTLLIRPAVNFAEGHRYIVALRELRDPAGDPIPAQRPFELYRDRVISSEPAIESRRAHFEQLFTELGASGIGREDLYAAWDFTVASERNLSERVLSIRDDAFARLGDTDLADLTVQGQAPSFAVTGVTDYEPCGDDGCASGDPIPLPDLPIGLEDLPIAGAILGPTQDQLATLLGNPPEDDRIARKVTGLFTVPCYLNLPGCPPGARFGYGADGLPQPNPVPHLATSRA
ncbi:MAG: hypothetical protein ACRDK9_10930 [Solirubrobacterales bacterium]